MIKLPQIDCQQVADQIGRFVIERVRKAAATGCVVGLSGGVDSSTTAAVIKRAFDKHNLCCDKPLELVGYILPSFLNSDQDATDAENLARRLGIRHQVCELEPVIAAFRTTNPEAFENHYHRGNLISRIRANVLNTKAATENKIVAGTGNKDEDFGIGYYTLFGDGAVHISPIAGLSKRLVRQLAAFLGLPDTIVKRTPTAGLEPGQTDFKDLGYDYDLVELVTEGLDQGLSRQQIENDPEIMRLSQQQIEFYVSSFGEKKWDSVSEIVSDICRRHSMAKMKMEVIHPPAAPVSLIYD